MIALIVGAVAVVVVAGGILWLVIAATEFNH